MNGKFFSSNIDQQSWPIIRQFVLLWMLLTLALVIAFESIYKAQERSMLDFVHNEELQAIKVASQFVTEELRIVHDDMFYLRDQPVLRDWLERESSPNQDRLSSDLLTFVKYRELYDSILFVDTNGKEKVRISRNRGQPVIVPGSELQDKSSLYFVEQALALNKDNIYISSFDLTIEHNKIEQPIKPVIRFGTPVFDQRGQKRGIILLNYRGQRVIDRFRTISQQAIGSLWLLNDKGYWLVGDRPEDEWGFIYPGRKDRSFANDYSEAWSAMMANPEQTQFDVNGDLFTYGEILPKTLFGDIPERIVSGDRRWLLVARVPFGTFMVKNVMGVRILAFIALFLLLGVVSWFTAHYRIRRRQIEEQVRISETRFRGLVESAPDGIVIVNKEGCIILVNVQAERWFGYSRDELLNQPIELLIPERFHVNHRQYRQAYTKDPVVRPMGVGLELFARRKDGSEIPVEINLSPLKIGQELFIISIIRDITGRKQSEQARREAQAKYQELVNNLRVGVYRHAATSDGCFLEVNPAIVEMFEAESAEQLQKYPVNKLCREPGCWREFIHKARQKGYIDNEEIPLVTLKGREFSASVTAAIKKDSAGNTCFDGIIENITERKAVEQRIQQLNKALRERATVLESVNHELEAFSYSVSHDLRAPLRAVDGFSRILLDEYADRLDETGRDRLRRVRAAAQRMATLIDDMLKLSRITRSELKREDVDLSALANEVIDELRRLEPNRVVQCTVQPGISAWGDARLLRIVLDNLLGNAWKFTSQQPDAHIEFGVQARSDQTVYFVRDNGAGFDMAYAEKLFGAFQRLHDASEFPGTGIGLATAQRVIHKHGGHICAESEVGKGATFYFTLEAREDL
ncbi:PAS domain S-box protein [Candidatus Methylobacter oryzae]|uniref:histidine kinase n=2 Tax=Candidatus Methylobacter oryzae TaxID=2497749 RepID=A0ABY3CE60_9GAMM|nr:PAS domain S-box protein [Candidatus Methylobacter oryzae]